MVLADPAELQVLADSGQRRKRGGLARFLSKEPKSNSDVMYEDTSSRRDTNGSTVEDRDSQVREKCRLKPCLDDTGNRKLLPRQYQLYINSYVQVG